MKLTKFDLRNKFALITGAAGLLGIEHALALLEINANIILTDINKKKINLVRQKLLKFILPKKYFHIKWMLLNQILLNMF